MCACVRALACELCMCVWGERVDADNACLCASARALVLSIQEARMMQQEHGSCRGCRIFIGAVGIRLFSSVHWAARGEQKPSVRRSVLIDGD